MPPQPRVATELWGALVEQPRDRGLLPARRSRRAYGLWPPRRRYPGVGPLIRSVTHAQTLAGMTDNPPKLAG